MPAVVDYCRLSAKLHICRRPTPLVFLSRILDQSLRGIGYYTIRVGFGMQIAKTDLYCLVICRVPLSVALSDHNPPTLQTDRQTDVMLVALKSTVEPG